MAGRVVMLTDYVQRDLAHQLVEKARGGSIVTFQGPPRTIPQNNLMWATMTDLSRAMPEDRRWLPITWKAACMAALGHEIAFGQGLDNTGPFPIDLKTSGLDVRGMADLITFSQAYGDQHGVRWSEPKYPAAGRAAKQEC